MLQTSLRFINRHGLYDGAANKLRTELDELQATHAVGCEVSQTMADRLVAFVENSENMLPDGDRAWLSTENLESLFGRYKRLEGQHSKGGFTSLIAALPMLLTDWPPEKVRTGLSAVTVNELKHWTAENLGTTLTSKCTTAYQEATTNTGQQKTNQKHLQQPTTTFRIATKPNPIDHTPKDERGL